MLHTTPTSSHTLRSLPLSFPPSQNLPRSHRPFDSGHEHSSPWCADRRVGSQMHPEVGRSSPCPGSPGGKTLPLKLVPPPLPCLISLPGGSGAQWHCGCVLTVPPCDPVGVSNLL